MRKLLYFSILVVMMFFSNNMLFAQSDKSCNVVLLAELQGNYRGNVSWSPDGKFIAAMFVELDDYSTLRSLTVHVLDSQTLELVTSLPQDILEASMISPLLWSPDSQSIAIVNGVINIVDIWNVTTGDVKRLKALEDEYVQEVTWSSDSIQLAITGVKRRPLTETRYVEIPYTVSEIARIWNVETQELLTTIEGDLAQIYITYYDGQWVVASRSTTDSMLRVTGLSDKKIYFEQTNAYIVDFKLISDDLMLATVLLNDDPFMNQGTVWNLTTEAEILEIRGEANLRASRFAEKGATFMAYTGTPDITLYALESGISLSFDNHSVNASPDGKWLLALEISSVGGSVTITPTGDFTLINLSNGEATVTFPGDLISVSSVAWSPDSQRVAVAGISGMLKVWSLEGCLNP